MKRYLCANGRLFSLLGRVWCRLFVETRKKGLSGKNVRIVQVDKKMLMVHMSVTSCRFSCGISSY